VVNRRDAHQLTLDELGTPLIDTTFVVLDLETTGLSATSDRITEVGAVKVRGGEVLGELRTFVHPGRPIPPGITAVTGITDAMVRDAPGLPAILPTVMRFLDGAVFVAHNAAFDLGFLRAAARATGHEGFEPIVLDTARLARRLVRDEVRDCRLATLARFFRSPTRAEHRALADARATVDVLHGLIERAGSLGATTVEDLRDLSSSRSDAAFRRRDLVSDAPLANGVYRFLDADDRVLYVGKATNLRDRLRTYFGQDPRRRIADLVRETARVDWTVTATLVEAEVREVREIHTHRPRYNRRSTRPEAAVHVALTREAFPRLSVVREPRPTHQRTVGPLPSRKVADRFVEAVLEVVPLRACSPRLRLAQDHPACVLKDLGRCGAPCDGTQSADAYGEVVADVLALLDDPERLIAPLRSRMADYAAAGRFERAVEIRRKLHGSARALHAARDHALLGAIDHLVASRTVDDGTEVVVVRRGRLVDSLRLPAGAGDAQVSAGLGTRRLPEVDTPPHRDDAEEVALVLAWLARPGVRLLEVEGELALPWAGGAQLHATVQEARQVARAVRRDRQHLSRTKVARRGPTADTPEATSA
jgi:DNA polymerase III subunit epsilon